MNNNDKIKEQNEKLWEEFKKKHPDHRIHPHVCAIHGPTVDKDGKPDNVAKHLAEAHNI